MRMGLDGVRREMLWSGLDEVRFGEESGRVSAWMIAMRENSQSGSRGAGCMVPQFFWIVDWIRVVSRESEDVTRGICRFFLNSS